MKLKGGDNFPPGFRHVQKPLLVRPGGVKPPPDLLLVLLLLLLHQRLIRCLRLNWGLLAAAPVLDHQRLLAKSIPVVVIDAVDVRGGDVFVS